MCMGSVEGAGDVAWVGEVCDEGGGGKGAEGGGVVGEGVDGGGGGGKAGGDISSNN